MLSTFRILLVLFSLLTIPNVLKSANCTTTAAGDFNNAAIWSCGSVPSNSDNITINHNVNLNRNFTTGGGNLGTLSGTLTVSAGVSLTSTTSNLTVSGSGELIVNGTFAVNNIVFANGSDVLFSSTSTVTIHGNFTNNNNSNNVTVNTTSFNVSGDLTNGNGGVVAGTGTIDVAGSVTNDGSGTILGCTGVACGCGDCVLAIDLLDFSLSNKDNEVTASWTTASEINNSHFVLEQSYDGLHYEEVARIQGKGNSTVVNHYSFTHSVAADLLYYRLVDYEFSGTANHHPAKSIALNLNSSENIKVNYFAGEFSFTGLKKENVVISIYQVNGQLLFSGHVNAEYSKVINTNFGNNALVIVQISNSETNAILSSNKVIMLD